MATNVTRGAAWILPLRWFDPRRAVQDIAIQAADSSTLIFVLSGFFGLAFGLDFAMRVETLVMKIVLTVFVGPMTGVAIVFGLSQLICEGYVRRGVSCSLPTLRAAAVVALNPLFWCICLRILAQWLVASAGALSLGDWVPGGAQIVSVMTLVLPWLSLWTWQVGLSEATGIPEDKINRRVTNWELLMTFVVIMVLLLGLYAVVSVDLM